MNATISTFQQLFTGTSEPYKCRMCGKWWSKVSNMSCCVMHSSGTCCHQYSDIEIEEPFYAKDQMDILRLAHGITNQK